MGHRTTASGHADSKKKVQKSPCLPTGVAILLITSSSDLSLKRQGLTGWWVAAHKFENPCCNVFSNQDATMGMILPPVATHLLFQGYEHPEQGLGRRFRLAGYDGTRQPFTSSKTWTSLSSKFSTLVGSCRRKEIGRKRERERLTFEGCFQQLLYLGIKHVYFIFFFACVSHLFPCFSGKGGSWISGTCGECRGYSEKGRRRNRKTAWLITPGLQK